MVISYSTLVEENSSILIEFDVYDADGVTPLTGFTVVPYIYIRSGLGAIEYINGRDGSDLTGLNITNNHIEFKLSPADNQVVDIDRYTRYGYEPHRVALKILYNLGNDSNYINFDLNIKPLKFI